MSLTNLTGLPEPLVEAVRNDPYDKGDCDFSATQLIAPAYLRKLLQEHGDEVDVDAADRIWSLLGQSVHGILERAQMPGYIMEHRYVGEFEVASGLKVRVGAKIDVFNQLDGILDDYKVTSVYKFKYGLDGFREPPPEYEAQINIQAECIFRETGIEVKQGRIIGILRDWRRSEAAREQGYPNAAVDIMLIPIWPRERRLLYIEERLAWHMNPDPPPCSSSERWERPPTWALMKAGQKRATKLFDNQEAANNALTYMVGEKTTYSVQTRPGSRTRCEGYCEVSSKCPNFQEYLKQKVEAVE